MEPVDAAAAALGKIVTEVTDYSETIKTEADTRLKVIDRVLTEVLGWQLADIQMTCSRNLGRVET